MDATVMAEWVREQQAISKLPNKGKWVLYVDSCSGHSDTWNLRTALEVINTEIRNLSKNAIDFVEPYDFFYCTAPTF